MSWLSDIGDSILGAGKSIVGSIFGGSTNTGIGSKIFNSLVSTAITGFALKKITDSISNSSSSNTSTAKPSCNPRL